MKKLIFPIFILAIIGGLNKVNANASSFVLMNETLLLEDSTNQGLDGDTSNNPQANGIVKPLPTSKRLDGIYERKTYKEKGIIPYDHIREADAFWQKRIWRIIDVREKMNKPFVYPKELFFDIVHRSVLSGEVQAFEDEEFVSSMSIEKVNSKGAGMDTVAVTDPITGDVTYVPQRKVLDPNKITKFRIKEDWVFDEETSTMQVRILGVAPILDKYDEGGNYLSSEAMYWIYYPDMRKELAKHEIFNPKNDAVRMTWEDIMEFRYFSSYIIKESNVYDRRIADYSNGVDALLESDRVKNDIFNFEHDLWSY